MFKDSKLQITNCFNTSLNTNPLYFSRPCISFMFCLFLVIFMVMGATREGLKYILNSQKKKEKKFKNLKPHNILNDWSPSYLPYY